ncbi:hypothetical protein ACEPAF_2356 [Sanghuangporus sanghuang]
MTESTTSSASDAADTYVPARVALRPLISNRDTEHLMDCWRILQRSSADAAVLPSSASNLFAFADSCIYIASVHDLNFVGNAEKKLERERQQAVKEANARGRAALKEPSFSSAYREGNLAKALHMAFSNNNSQPPTGGCENDPFGATNWQAQASSSSTGNTSHAAGNAEADQYRITPYYCNDNATTVTDAPRPQEQIIPDELDDLNNFDTTIPEEEGLWTNPKSEPSDLIGIVYLYTASDAASAACEVSLGVALLPHARGRGCGTETVRQLIGLAFDEFNFHRISAGVIGPSLCRAARPTVSNTASGGAKEPNAPLLSGTIAKTEAALRMFVALGFTLEGTRRRAIPDVEDNGVWRDAHYLALLDTDWFTLCARQNAKSVNPKNRRTRWDEMLARHLLEADDLLSAESRLKRSASTETLRPGAQTNGAAIGINLAPSSVSGSSAPSEAANENGAREERGQTQGQEGFFSSARAPNNPFSSFSSVSSSAPNYFRSDPFAAHILQSRRKPVFTFGGDSESASQAMTDLGDAELRSDNEELLIDFEEAHEKVEDFLRKNPAPGPPPSEAGTNLDSEAEAESASASDFESCADPDELDLPSGGNTKGKGKAKEVEVDRPVQDVDQEQMRSLATGVSIPATYLNVPRQKEPSTSVSPPDDDESGAEEQQTRKKRRFSNGVTPEQDSTRSNDRAIAPSLLPATTTGILHDASRPFDFNFNGSGFSFNAPRLVSSPADVEAGGQLVDTLSSHHQPASVDAESHRFPDTDRIADADSEMSDAESISTASTWDVVSIASAPRSPSPTTSLSSGTGSLSLQSASESEDE